MRRQGACPNQSLTLKFPVLHYGRKPPSTGDVDLRVYGESVRNAADLGRFQQIPTVRCAQTSTASQAGANLIRLGRPLFRDFVKLFGLKPRAT